MPSLNSYTEFLKIESYRKGLFLSSFFNIIAKTMTFLMTLATAYYFGTQPGMDLYFYCVSAIMLAAGFIVNIDSAVIIPESMRLAEQEGPDQAMRFLNFFLYAYCAAGLALALVLLASPVRILLLISKFDEPLLRANLGLILASVPLVLLMVVNSYLVDIFTSRKFFTLPVITNMVTTVICFIFLVLFHAKLGAASLMLGLLSAALLQCLFLLSLARRCLGWTFSLPGMPVGKTHLQNVFYSITGNVTTICVSYVPLFLLSGFGAGVIASLNYGQQVAAIPAVLITNQFSSVAGIKFNELYAKRELGRLSDIFVSSTRFLIFILVPVSFFLFVYAREIVTVLFQRGAFDASSTAASALFLKYLALLLPLYALNTLVTRALMSAQKVKEGFWYQAGFNITLTLLMYAAILRFGALGYPLSLVFVYSVNCVFYYFFLKALIPEIRYERTLVYFAWIAALNAGLFGLLAALKNVFSAVPALPAVVAGGAACAALLLALNAVFKLNTDVNDLLSKCAGFARKALP